MNELALYAFFKSLLNYSLTFQGRFAVLEGYGNDLNADNNDDVLVGNIINQQKWTKKYPCVVVMPPRETGNNPKKMTSRFLIQMYFVSTTYYDGIGQTKKINVQTNTSKKSILEEWEEMRNEAAYFHTIMMNKFYGDITILNSFRPVKTTPVTIERFSMKNNDRLSGVVMTFEIDVVGTCSTPTYANTFTTLADYACFNSDLFLTALTTPGNTYLYECTEAIYDGNALALGSQFSYNSINAQRIPVQPLIRRTIPAHDIDDPGVSFLTYDKNWIDFLNSLPIATFLKFRTSPFNIHSTPDKIDFGFPVPHIGGAIIDPSVGVQVYGEGFQIEWPRGKTFSFTIDFLYGDAAAHTTTKLHTIIYTETGMTIDGALVPNANLLNVNEYI